MYLFDDDTTFTPDHDIPARLLDAEISFPDEEVIRTFFANKGIILQIRKKVAES